MTRQAKTDLLEACLHDECASLPEPLRTVCCHALAGGQRMRGLLLLDAAGRTDAPAMLAACALEMLHAATLLQDDIFDASTHRRGRLAAYVRFGKAQAVLASDWLLIRSLQLAAALHPEFFRELSATAADMTVAVARELTPARTSSLAGAQEYVTAVNDGKTASLFGTTLFAAALLHTSPGVSPQQWKQVGCSLGRVYQLVDDCNDACADAQDTGTIAVTDLEKGRVTLPVLLAVEELRRADPEVQLAGLTQPLGRSVAAGSIAAALASTPVRRRLREQVCSQLTAVGTEARQAHLPDALVQAFSAEMHSRLSGL